jgi:glycosyltransferase involved in cell wall biosynthesis
MKIALLHYTSPPVVGGVERVLARQAVLLANAGHQVQIITGRGAVWDERILVDVIPELDSRHPSILALKQSLDRGILPATFKSMVETITGSLQPRLAELDWLIVHNVASLHKNLALTAALFNLSNTLHKPRLLLWHHDFAWTGARYINELHPGYPWDLLRTAWPRAVQVTISDARQTEMSLLFGIPLDAIQVIPNGVDQDTLLAIHPGTRDLIERFELDQASPLILTPVRLTLRKNLEFGLRILASLQNLLPQAKWVVTGPLGAHNPENLNYYHTLANLRRELGLEKSAIFLAEIRPDGLPDEQIADLYRRSDALLLTSLEEGFGLPMIEAGLVRLPIFASDIPSLRALGREWATFFALDDPPAGVAAQIANRLSADPAYRMRSHVRENFTWEAIYASRIVSILQLVNQED